MTKPKPARRRDSDATRRRILDAALAVLAEDGFGAFGVNALAKRADADKVLIYRYFGGLEGVLEALANRIDLWIDSDALDQVPAGGYAEVFGEFLVRYARALRRNDLVRRVLAWELVENNDGVRKLGEARARAVRAWFAKARVKAQAATADPDAPAINALLIAGVHHLVLRELTAGEFAGLDLRDPSGWTRVESAIRRVIDAIHRPASA